MPSPVTISLRLASGTRLRDADNPHTTISQAVIILCASLLSSQHAVLLCPWKCDIKVKKEGNLPISSVCFRARYLASESKVATYSGGAFWISAWTSTKFVWTLCYSIRHRQESPTLPHIMSIHICQEYKTPLFQIVEQPVKSCFTFFRNENTHDKVLIV